MCDPFTVVAAATVATSVIKGIESKKQADFQAALEKRNAEMADKAAEDAMLRGDYQVGVIRMKTAKLISRQRTAYAAAGVDPSVGTAADFQTASQVYGDMDISVSKADAAREAWGYRVQGANNLAQASAYKSAGNDAVIGSILGGAGQVMSAYGTLGSGRSSYAGPKNFFTS